MIAFSSQKLDHVLDNMVLMCHANNPFGSVNHTFNIMALKSLKFLSSPPKDEIKLDVGGNFSINCTVDGWSKPKITWFKDGKLLETDGSHLQVNVPRIANQTNLSIDKMNLLVTNANMGHFGEYTCVAENNWGTIKRNFNIIANPFWSKWSKWSACSSVCGHSVRERHRICHKVRKNRTNCIGNAEETRICKKKPCAGVWTSWSNWSSCSRTCGYIMCSRRCSISITAYLFLLFNIIGGTGQTYRHRECKDGRCTGASIEVTSCYRAACIGSNSDKSRFYPLFTYESKNTNERDRYNNRNTYKRGKSTRDH